MKVFRNYIIATKVTSLSRWGLLKIRFFLGLELAQEVSFVNGATWSSLYSSNGAYAGAIGYSDILIAPNLSALDIMLKIAQDFNISNGLKFSTDLDPKKSKTKCIAWLKNSRELPKLSLCGNLLPWVDRVIHLVCTLTNKSNMLEDDMNRKKARYISRNIELNQKLHFAASE